MDVLCSVHIVIDMKESHKILIGKTFGSLIIKNITPYYSKSRSNQRNYNVEVYCSECEKIGTLRLRSVLEGLAKSCGCLRYKKPSGLNNKKCVDITNQKFGKLTALRIDPARKNRVFWMCQCDCGKQKSVAAKHLRIGAIKSCGCDKHLSGKQSPCWRGYEGIGRHYWSQVKRGAHIRGFEFKIDMKYAWSLFVKQHEKCALTGQTLVFPSKTAVSDGTASLDRIDSSKGYIKGNVWWVHKDVNLMKMDFPLDIFRQICKMVAAYEFTT